MTRSAADSLRTFTLRYAMLPPLLGLTTGILSGVYIENPWLVIAILGVLAGIAGLFVPALRFLLFIPVGLLLTSPNPSPEGANVADFIGRNIDIEGSVYSSPEIREKGWRIFLDADYVIEDRRAEQVNGRVVIYTDSPAPSLNYGDRIRVIGIKLRPIETFKNPGSFDMKGFYSRQGVEATGFIEGQERIISFGRDSSYNKVLYGLDRLRHGFGRYVRAGFRYPANEVLNALTIGEDGGIPNGLRTEFSKSGVAHVLSISGLHVGAVAVVFYLFFKWLLKRSEYMMLRFRVPRIAAALTILPLFFYIAIAGFSTPAVRAFIMISLFLLAIIAGRSDNKINTLGAAAFIILLWRPPALFELSFQLSFAAVLGILLTNIYYPFKLETLGDKLLSLVKTTCAATFATLPLIVNSFGVLPVVSIPANLVFVPLVELLVVPLGLVSFLAYVVSPHLASPLIAINIHLLEMMIFGIGLLLRLPYSSVSIPPLGPLSLSLFAALGAAALLSARRKNVRYAVPVIAAALIVSSAYPVLSTHLGKNLSVSFLDAGKNRSAVLAAFPGGKNVLITGGRSTASGSYVYQAVIGRFLQISGVNTIDCLILTSTDKSSLDGAKYLIGNFDVKKIITDGDKLEGGLWELIRANGIEWRNLREIDNIYLSSESGIEVLRPGDTFSIEDSSYPRPAILKITRGGESILIGESLNEDGAVKGLIERYGTALKGRVLFVPGTGSGGALKELVSFASPEALITGGEAEGESLVLPRPVMVFSTEEDGAVTVTTGGSGLAIKSYTGETSAHLR